MVAPNPAQALLKLLSLLVIGGCGWVLFLFAHAFVLDLPQLTWWHLAYASLVPAFIGCGLFFAFGLKTPTHSHLSLMVAAVFVAAIIIVPQWAGKITYSVFVPDIAEPVNRILFWFYFVFALILAITTDWRIGKAAGFTAASQSWWTERHIRGFCVFLGWWLFFGGMGWTDQLSEAEHLFVQPLGHSAEALIFPTFVAICFFTGIALPRIVMSLTGIAPAPRLPRRRRKGFHLWQSTEPVPPSAPTESNP